MSIPSTSFNPNISVGQTHDFKGKVGDDLIRDKDKTLTGHDFMKLFVWQLRNQNPMEPMSSSDMMGQIQSLTSANLSESLDRFSKVQNSALGQGMLGREVVIQTVDTSGKTIEVKGMVASIENIGKSSCKIEVNGNLYDPGDVVKILCSPEAKDIAAPLSGDSAVEA